MIIGEDEICLSEKEFLSKRLVITGEKTRTIMEQNTLLRAYVEEKRAQSRRFDQALRFLEASCKNN